MGWLIGNKAKSKCACDYKSPWSPKREFAEDVASRCSWIWTTDDVLTYLCGFVFIACLFLASLIWSHRSDGRLPWCAVIEATKGLGSLFFCSFGKDLRLKPPFSPISSETLWNVMSSEGSVIFREFGNFEELENNFHNFKAITGERRQLSLQIYQVVTVSVAIFKVGAFCFKSN